MGVDGLEHWLPELLAHWNSRTGSSSPALAAGGPVCAVDWTPQFLVLLSKLSYATWQENQELRGRKA
jgi:hypothetical protein